MQVIIHKLYKSKSSKTKHTQSHCISDKHNDCQLSQRAIILKV